MPDKVERIKQEIERRIENLKISLDKNCVTEESKLDIRGNITALYGLLKFIDSLPKEPKKQPKFKVGDTIKGPCNNIFQVKEVLDKQYLLHSENGDELNSIEIVDANSCIVEESSCNKKDYRERYKRIAQTEQFKSSYCDKSLGKEESGCEVNCTTRRSDDLEEEIRQIAGDYEQVDVAWNNDFDFIAHHFAEWQKKKDVEEMMKTLIGGEIVKDIHNQLSVKSEPLNDTFGDIKFGDKVKVKILNKED